MDGTTQARIDDNQPSPPPAAELEGRLRDICLNGAEPWKEAREKRREARRRDMEILRLSSMESAMHASEYIAGRLPYEKERAFLRLRDPLASLANLNRSIVQIVMLEERLDESDDERAARMKEEAEAKARAEQAAMAARDAKAGQARRSETRRRVHEAVRAISLACLEPRLDDGDFDYHGHESLLDDVFEDYESVGDYDGEPARIVADIVTRLGLVRDAAPDPDDKPADLITRRDRVIALARAYLEDTDRPEKAESGGESVPAGSSPPPATLARAQGPPG